ncbi:MAG: aldo/keto reductase, partial [Lachnospiraceae bacterium]|nr:aldo/keto reductase [Lachnospiraceae bacterium]
AKEQGKIRFISITNHRLAVAQEAIDSGLYDSLQFPFCYLSSEKDIRLVQSCREHNIGFIAMKSLSGGLINNSAAAYAFAAQYDNVLPIWGIQKETELDEFLSYNSQPPVMTPEIRELIEKDRSMLSGSFCRGCGYCMPCPAGIEINNCARMSLLLRRSPTAGHLSAKGQEKMMKIKDCLHCGQCMSRCPYGLNTPQLLERNLKDYEEILAGKVMTPTNF